LPQLAVSTLLLAEWVLRVAPAFRANLLEVLSFSVAALGLPSAVYHFLFCSFRIFPKLLALFC
jgi:hypothetical protein